MKPPQAKPKADAARDARLAKALRDNLRRRKVGGSVDGKQKDDEG